MGANDMWFLRLGFQLKQFVKARASPELLRSLRSIRASLQKRQRFILTIWGRMVKNQINLRINTKKSRRYLEIGPGNARLPSFETVDVFGGWNVDYVCDAAKPLPFKDGTFDLIYASHVLEHIPWYKTEEVLKEWVRVLKHGGELEVWVPDGLKICKTLIEAELDGVNHIDEDGWYRFNPRRDPCVWAAGRIFSYGDGTGAIGHPNWHRAIFTPRYLKDLFERVELIDVRELDRSEVRGYDHGWINLGMRGRKL